MARRCGRCGAGAGRKLPFTVLRSRGRGALQIRELACQAPDDIFDQHFHTRRRPDPRRAGPPRPPAARAPRPVFILYVSGGGRAPGIYNVSSCSCLGISLKKPAGAEVPVAPFKL
ncbi:hypothetical protein EVAR_66117_1 [Eumeta japonica]|uniref:Uncharacterized protein n=1 Tax=Eumeta variegata TaxID=151549 RepID=A0A4C2AA49_EUMVA|nr:hypothetical protein EVAR_66117_1 [Eumeta japonica]